MTPPVVFCSALWDALWRVHANKPERLGRFLNTTKMYCSANRGGRQHKRIMRIWHLREGDVD